MIVGTKNGFNYRTDEFVAAIFNLFAEEKERCKALRTAVKTSESKHS